MNNIQLGKKLKEARLAKKMTQSDVVGTFITRNMLSRIESGTAFPSLRTLEYLANTLEIPIHYLVAENEENTDGEIVIPDAEIVINNKKITELPIDELRAYLNAALDLLDKLEM
jgi:transcriptional regulator with XRE-family HTH domain